MTSIDLIKTTTSYIITGKVLNEKGLPNHACLVVLFCLTTNQEITPRATSGSDGNFTIIHPIPDLSSGLYQVRVYGNGGTPDEGLTYEYKNYPIAGTGEASSGYLTSSGGTIIKFANNTYTPSPITISANISCIYSPTYTWTASPTVLVSPGTSDSLTLSASALFTSADVETITCTINGVDKDGVDLQPIIAKLSFVKIIDGSSGPGLVYRGIWQIGATYYRTDVRADVVKYDNTYKICALTNSDSSFIDLHWNNFEDTFSSVATALLLTEDATITKTLVMGELGNVTDPGIIRSAGANSLLDGNGFYLSSTNDVGIFRVGAASGGVLTNGLSFDGSSFQVKAAHAELTSDGNFWANAGGFGGASPSSPYITLDSNGLTIFDDAIPRVILNDTSTLFNDWSTAKGSNLISHITHDCDMEMSDLSLWDVVLSPDGLMFPAVAKSTATRNYITSARCLEMTVNPYDDHGVPLIGGARATVKMHNYLSLTGNTGSTFTISFWYNTDALPPGQRGPQACVNIYDTNGAIIKSWNLGYGIYSDHIDTGQQDTFYQEIYDEGSLLSGWQQFVGTFDSAAQSLKVEFTIYNEAQTGVMNCSQLFIDDIEIANYEPFILLSKQGLLAFQTPASYFKVGPGVFELKGTTIHTEDLIVTGHLYVYGQTFSAANNLGGTTSSVFTIGTATTAVDTELVFGSYSIPTSILANGTSLVCSTPVEAPLFTSNGKKIGIPTIKTLTLRTDCLSIYPIDIPDGISYSLGSGTLIVFLDGRLQTKDLTYTEVGFAGTSCQIKFLENLAAGAVITFIILGW